MDEALQLQQQIKLSLIYAPEPKIKKSSDEGSSAVEGLCRDPREGLINPKGGGLG